MSYSLIKCFWEEKKLCQLIWEYSTPLLLEGFRWTRVLEGGWKGSGLTAAHVISIEMLLIQNVYFPSHLRRSSFGWIHCFEHAKRLFQDSNHSDEVTWKMMASENKYGQKSLFMNDVFNGEGQCVGQGINSGNKRMFEDIWSQDNISESIWPFKHPTASVL